MYACPMRTTLDIDIPLLDAVREAGRYRTRKETLAEALRLLQRRIALATLAADIGKHADAVVANYDPEKGEA